MNEYKLRFDVDHIQCDTFKEKHCYIINRNIEDSRLCVFMKFNSYGRITFDEDDIRHKNPIVTEQEKFNRLRTNCIIYDLIPNDYNPGLYDKVFIYQTLTTKSGWFGFIMYNTKTGDILHKYYIEYVDCSLMIGFHKVFRYLLELRQKDHICS